MLKSRIYVHRLVSTRFQSSNRHDFKDNMDEIEKGNLKFYKKSGQFSNFFSKDYRKEKREFEKMSNDKMMKDFLYEQAARKMSGFIYENSAGWVIEDYGSPRDVITLQVKRRF